MRHSNLRDAAVATLLTILGTAACSVASPIFKQAPVIEANPNPRVPLAALLRFAADRPVTTRIEVSDGDRSWTVRHDAAADPSQGLALLGFRPGRAHEVFITVTDGKGASATYPQRLTFRPAPLPSDRFERPPFKVTIAKSNECEPGVTLMTVRRTGRDATKYTLLLGMDPAGRVVWTYRSPDRISDVEPLRNGNILYMTTDFRVIEIDMLGNVVQAWYPARRPQGPAEGIAVDALAFHHEIDELPSGNLLALSASKRRIDNYYTSERDPNAPRKTQDVMGDEIVEFQRDGKVVWRWNAFDHLDPFRIGYETFTQYWPRRGFPETRDWTHGNGLYYNARDDSILVSLRFQEAIVKIDRATGEIKWILGEPSGWRDDLKAKLLEPRGNWRWFYHQHTPSLIGDDMLLLFDNGNYGARPFEPPLPREKIYSRAVIYQLNETERTVRQTWCSDTAGEDAVQTFAMGEAISLPQTGNVLVTYGLSSLPGTSRRGTRTRQYTRTTPPRVVWEVVISDESGQPPTWMTYGVKHLPCLYGTASYQENHANPSERKER